MKAGPRMRTAATIASRDFGPNMTPMVDVVMVILIFFMAGSSLLGPEWFLGATVEEATPAPAGNTAPPTADEDPFQLDLPPTRVRVEMSRDERGVTRVTGLNVVSVDVDEFARRVEEVAASGAAPTLEIIVQPSAETPYQDVIRVYEMCVGAGPRSASLARSRGPADLNAR